ncbi:hypothetical protein [Kordia sp.]|uniref:hypothetical protein n=1 Tax=Kordia sp. TaxID=1965332 RepID=UPI003B594818
METTAYLAATYYVLILNSILALALLLLLRIGKASKTIITITGTVLFIYIIFEHWGIGSEHIFPKDISGGTFFIIILIGAILGIGLLYLTLKRYFFNLSQEHLQMTQGLRVLVSAGFFTEAALGVIPLEFGIMDGFMHAASAFTALIAAILYVKNTSSKNTALWIANIIGVTDILIIVTSICFWVWKDIGPNHNMQYVVFFGGVIFLWIHFVSIYKLLTDNK